MIGYENKKVKIAGKEYNYIPMKVKDTFKLGILLSDFFKNFAYDERKEAGEYKTIGEAIKMFLSANFEEISEFLANRIGISAEEFMELPAGAEIEVLEVFLNSDDWKKYFETIQKKITRLAEKMTT